MPRKIILFILIILFISSSCSKSTNESIEEEHLTVQGTVYVNEVPAGNVLVEGYFSGQRQSENTNENGKYSLSGTGFGRSRTYIANYAVRAMNPFTEDWSELRRGQGPIGTTLTEDFYFTEDS